ncbi:MAG TPA: hypothetical protein VMI06_03130 [Terriglobia bacterium]|nr:hypothetical protein [Terriglobia bacterium]
MRKIAGFLILAAAMAAALPAKGVTVFSTGSLTCSSSKFPLSLTLTGVSFNYARVPDEKVTSSMVVYFPMDSHYGTYQEYATTNVVYASCTVTANVAGANGLPAAVKWSLKEVNLTSITATAGGPSTLEGLSEPFATVALTLSFTEETVSSGN